ncbi:hypothetical protein B566_EDAN007716 [Ephemera danica]|nr:hypothetical protein B566_EDAN007716 [Ephemera danica]
MEYRYCDTMLEDLKDAAHVIAFIYNQGDTATTAKAASKVMKELQSMSLDIEKKTIESVMIQIWSVLHIPEESQCLVVEQDDEMLAPHHRSLDLKSFIAQDVQVQPQLQLTRNGRSKRRKKDSSRFHLTGTLYIQLCMNVLCWQNKAFSIIKT